MEKISVRNRQSWLDLALLASGGVDSVFDLLDGVSLTESPDVGQEIAYHLKKGVVLHRSVLDYYVRNEIIPVTGLSVVSSALNERGIGYMSVGVDFSVS